MFFLLELELFTGEVTWEYGQKWTGQIQFSEVGNRFNPKTHSKILQNENNNDDENDRDSKSDGVFTDGSQLKFDRD